MIIVAFFMSHKIKFQLWIGYLKSISFELANHYSWNIVYRHISLQLGFFIFLQFNLEGDLPEISNMEIEDLGKYHLQRF